MTMAEVVLALVAGSLLVLVLPPLRRRLITPWVMARVSRTLPPMSETERVALEAGTVWWDGELFSGDPEWTKLLAFRPRPLSAP